MPTVTQLIRRSVESKVFHETVPPLDELRRTEWCDEFETLMRNRLLMGAFRYGLIRIKCAGQRWDNTASAQKRLDKYRVDGNLEHLIDIANIMMIEFISGKFNGQTLHAIDDGDHVQQL